MGSTAGEAQTTACGSLKNSLQNLFHNLMPQTVHRTYSYPDIVADFEALVGSHEDLEAFGEPTVLPYVGLKSLHAVVADDEPELERSKAAAQRDAPMLKLKSPFSSFFGKQKPDQMCFTECDICIF